MSTPVMVPALSVFELGGVWREKAEGWVVSMRGGSRDAENDADMQRYIINRVYTTTATPHEIL